LRGDSQTPCYKLKNRFNLFPRHVELFHNFRNAQVFQVFEYGRNRHTGVAKHPSPLRLPGTLSTAAHCDQSRIAVSIWDALFLSGYFAQSVHAKLEL